MKQLKYIIGLLLVFSCDSENVNDCFQKAGAIVTQDITVPSFDKILVNRDIALILTQGATQSVVIETGENLLNDVVISVVNGTITLTDNNACNYVRDYGITKVYITAPNITEIRSSTQFDIVSNGVLTYPALSIFSEDFNAPDTFTVGDFVLDIDNASLNVNFNGLSIAYISGRTSNLNVNLASGDGRFEGRDLIAQRVNVFQRSSNDMVVNPQQELTGQILSTGNVIAVNRPSIVNVDVLYNGRLIFE